jgi:hypothetical protein
LDKHEWNQIVILEVVKEERWHCTLLRPSHETDLESLSCLEGNSNLFLNSKGGVIYLWISLNHLLIVVINNWNHISKFFVYLIVMSFVTDSWCSQNCLHINCSIVNCIVYLIRRERNLILHVCFQYIEIHHLNSIFTRHIICILI